jgi:hypothetical protein
VQLTPLSLLATLSGLGEGEMDHTEPFHDSTSVVSPGEDA